MSLTKKREMREENLAAHQANGAQSQGPVTPEGKAQSAAANLREGFYDRPRAETLARLGEEPEDYLCMMESLQEDLQPRPGLESLLVTQMGETLWGMQRAQRMREGLAVKRIQSKVTGEEMLTTTVAAKAIENLEPFERLQAALARHDKGPTEEEVEAFVECRKADSSAETQEFILLLRSLKEPLEEADRKAARRQARVQLRGLMEGFESTAWVLTRQANRVRSPENLAALMAPEDANAKLLQRWEDSHLRRLWRLTSTLAKVRGGALEKKDVKVDVRSRNMYENKQNSDIMTGQNSDKSAKLRQTFQKKATL